MMEILDGSNGSRRLQIEFLRNGETERPFVKLRAVRIGPGAIPPWETHETEPELYDPRTAHTLAEFLLNIEELRWQR
jgi:hypothetical protein